MHIFRNKFFFSIYSKVIQNKTFFSKKLFCLTTDFEKLKMESLRMENEISKNPKIYTKLTKNIFKYLSASSELYNKMGEDAIKISYDVSNEPSNEYLKDELIRINTQLHLFQREMNYFEEMSNLINEINFNEELVKEAIKTGETEIAITSKTEIKKLKKEIEDFENEIVEYLIPEEEDDNKNITLEIKSAAGGSESSLFAGDLFEMYRKYSNRMGWNWEEISFSTDFAIGRGCKNGLAKIKGESVYKYMKYEGGVHKVQRVPETENKGRVHSSTCQVIVMPEAKLVNVTINERDLKIDTYRASGAGGQHVNTTDSAVRITHIPTGIVVTNQDEREQHRNKAKALENLKKKIREQEHESFYNSQNANKKKQMGSGNLNEKIRTYNWHDNRITDHRIGVTLFGINKMLDGEHLENFIDKHLENEKLDKLQQILKRFVEDNS